MDKYKNWCRAWFRNAAVLGSEMLPFRNAAVPGLESAAGNLASYVTIGWGIDFMCLGVKIPILSSF